MNLFLQLTASTSHFPVTAVSVLIVGFILAVIIGSILNVKRGLPLNFSRKKIPTEINGR